MKLKLYLWLLGISMTVVFIVNAFFLNTGFAVWQLALYTYANSIAIFTMDAIVATAIHALPAKWFNPYYGCYRPFKWEKKFFRMIRIVDWKDYIPDTGKLTTGLSKSEINSTEENYLFKFLVETCYAETIHYWMAISGVFVFFTNPRELILPMMLPLACINLCLNIPPVLIQRNNRPKLLYIYEHKLKKATA